jgi:hypothetical protein
MGSMGRSAHGYGYQMGSSGVGPPVPTSLPPGEILPPPHMFWPRASSQQGVVPVVQPDILQQQKQRAWAAAVEQQRKREEQNRLNLLRQRALEAAAERRAALEARFAEAAAERRAALEAAAELRQKRRDDACWGQVANRLWSFGASAGCVRDGVPTLEGLALVAVARYGTNHHKGTQSSSGGGEAAVGATADGATADGATADAPDGVATDAPATDAPGEGDGLLSLTAIEAARIKREGVRNEDQPVQLRSLMLKVCALCTRRHSRDCAHTRLAWHHQRARTHTHRPSCWNARR